MELPNGDVYMGEWKKNMVCIRIGSSSELIGLFKANKLTICIMSLPSLQRHGIGGLMIAGGDTYECEWAFGEPQYVQTGNKIFSQM